MVSWHVVVEYDGDVIFDEKIEAKNNMHAYDEAKCRIYDYGLVNPYLFVVSQKLSFKIEQVK